MVQFGFFFFFLHFHIFFGTCNTGVPWQIFNNTGVTLQMHPFGIEINDFRTLKSMFLYFIIHLNKGIFSILISPPWEKFGNFSKFHFRHSLTAFGSATASLVWIIKKHYYACWNASLRHSNIQFLNMKLNVWLIFYSFRKS